MARVLCISSEPSGDYLLSCVVRYLVENGHEAIGVGGSRSQESGLAMVGHIKELSAGGLFEALHALPAHLRYLSRLKGMVPGVDALLVVDSPELGMRLIKAAVRVGRPVFYLAPPQAWAWRPWRASRLRLCTWVGCLFDFEARWYQGRGVEAVCVGHPLVSKIEPRLDMSARRLGLLPGSRQGYVHQNLPIMLDAARVLLTEGEIDSVVIGLHSDVRLGHSLVEALTAEKRIKVAVGVEPVLAEAGLIWANFGTVTLESAMAGVPTIGMGRVNRLSYEVARRLVTAPHLMLPNLVLGRRAFPELVQDEFTRERIVETHRAALSKYDVLRGACLSLQGRLKDELVDEFASGFEQYFGPSD